MLSGFQESDPSFESRPSYLGEKRNRIQIPKGIGKIPVEKNAYLISQETSSLSAEVLGCQDKICREIKNR